MLVTFILLYIFKHGRGINYKCKYKNILISLTTYIKNFNSFNLNKYIFLLSIFKELVFDNVLVRVHKDYALEMHVNIDAGNGAGLKNDTMVELLK